MKNFQNADFNNENDQQSTNSLSKSADILSTRDLILSLNDSFISKKSKEYNFDFAKAASYDADQTRSLLGQKTPLSPNLQEKPKKLKMIARKTASKLNKETEERNNFEENPLINKNNLNVIFEGNFNNELKSKQNFGNFARNNKNDAIRKIKERLQALQQKKKFEFYEAKNQEKQDLDTREIEVENNTNVFFE